MSDVKKSTNRSQIQAISSLAHLDLEDETKLSAKRMFPSLILGVFFVAMLLALISGVMVYQSISGNIDKANTAREGAGLICNAAHANDADGAIAVGQGPEGRSLVIVEKTADGTYETRFYLSDGKLLQEYSVAGSPYTPENASVVTTTSTFDFTYQDGLLTVSTDQGTAETALRSLEGGK